LVAGIGAVFATSAPAQAAPKPIGLSADGITYADSLPASLFAGALIVPGKSVTRSFWVKNQATDIGNLAIALKDVTSVDSAFLGALSLQLTAGSTTGASVVFATANPCRSLLSAIPLASGAVVRVDAVLSLSSSLTNVTSQSSVGGFNLPVTLTSTDVAAPNGCGVSTPVTPPVTPPATGGPATTPPGTIDIAVISGASDGAILPTLGEGPLSGLGGKGAVRTYEIAPNTGRFWQEFDIVGYLVALVLGGIFAWRRRRRSYEEEAYA